MRMLPASRVQVASSSTCRRPHREPLHRFVRRPLHRQERRAVVHPNDGFHIRQPDSVRLLPFSLCKEAPLPRRLPDPSPASASSFFPRPISPHLPLNLLRHSEPFHPRLRCAQLPHRLPDVLHELFPSHIRAEVFQVIRLHHHLIPMPFPCLALPPSSIKLVHALCYLSWVAYSTASSHLLLDMGSEL